MKISLKLHTEISKSIDNHVFNMLCALDEKDRKDEISHSVWKELFETICKEKSLMAEEIFQKIESYKGKR